jgi:hypothetical protein
MDKAALTIGFHSGMRDAHRAKVSDLANVQPRNEHAKNRAHQ